MGQKVHPIGFRLGLNQRHQSEWFHSLRNFPSLLLEEKIIRDGLAKQYKEAGIEKVRITRDHQQHISLNIYALWHEKLLDDSNNELQTLRTFVQGVIKSPLVSITLEPTDTTHARLVAMSIAAEVEQRKPFRRAMKNALKDLMSKNVDGAKIQISGMSYHRLNCYWRCINNNKSFEIKYQRVHSFCKLILSNTSVPHSFVILRKHSFIRGSKLR